MVLCVDEKTAIQALDRLDPVLPLSPGRAERHGFEYCPPGPIPGRIIAGGNRRSRASHYILERDVIYVSVEAF